MSKKPTEIPPPPATGGTHVFDPKSNTWATTDETVQPWDPAHPDNQQAAPDDAPAQTPLKDA